MEDPIIPTCNRLLSFAIVAALPLGQLGASTPPIAERDRLATYVEARTADSLGDERRAASLFVALARADPGNRTLTRRAIGSAIDAGDTRLAIEVARSLPVETLALDARLLLVADALRRGKSAEAITLVEGKGVDGDGYFLAPLLRGWAEQASGGDGAVLLNNLGSETPLAAFVGEQRAAMLLSSRRIEEARALIAPALDAAGGRETRLRLAFAAMLARGGARDEAQKLLVGEDPALARLDLRRPQPGVAIDTPAAGYAEFLIGMAISLAQGNDRSLPLTLVQVARHAAPDNSEAQILAGLMLDRAGRHADAIAALEGVSADDPLIDDALDSRSRMLVVAGRGAEALAMASSSAAARGAIAADHARLGNVLADLDRHAEAADAFGRAAALADQEGASDRWTYRLLRAAQLDEVDRWPEARAELQLGLASAPQQPLLLNYLGYGSLERGENLDQAEEMIRRALALRPGDSSITDSLGWALYKRGRLPEAIEALGKAAAAEPAEADIQEHLGDALYRAGRRYEARFAWRAALVTAEAEEQARIEAKIASGWSEATAAP